MCGRYRLSADEQRLIQEYIDEFSDLRIEFHPTPRWNVAPMQTVAAIRPDGKGDAHLVGLKWGLVPFWSKEPKSGYSTINARSETVATSPAYREPFKKRRCLLLADGFYEWQVRPGKAPKQPFCFKRKDGQPFAFAAVWDTWKPKEGDAERLETCALITTSANSLVQPVHDRMPVMLDASSYRVWLDPAARVADLERLLLPYPAERMELQPVSLRLGNPKNEGPDLMAPD